jgi:hypothetical protein
MKLVKMNLVLLLPPVEIFLHTVDGKDDKKDIRDFVDNYFLARDSRAFRDHIKATQPDVDLLTIVDSGEEVEVPIGLSFFWPDYK